MSVTTKNLAADEVIVQRNRAVTLEVFYLQDGRHHPDHPQHGLYTGLFAQSQQQTPDPC